MKRILLLLITVLSLGIGYGQVTIAQQDFEVSPTAPIMTYTGGAIATGTGPFPSGDNNFVSGTRGLEESNGTSTVLFSTVDASSYTDVDLTFRLASFAGTSGNGADGADEVYVDVSSDAGSTWSRELEIQGNSNARWSFSSGTGSVSEIYDGNNTEIIYTPAGGGNRTTDGYSFITLTDLPEVADLRIRIVMNNNSANEYWIIDDVEIEGISASTDTEVELALATYSAAENGTSVMICADITNESASTATTADLVLTSLGTPHLTAYTTQTLTFPANSSAQQCVTIAITDDATCDGGVTYDFELNNVMGGTFATVGTQNTTQLSISDDEQVVGSIEFQGFEGSGWSYTESPATYNTSGDVWAIVASLSGITPATGSNFWGMSDLANSNGGTATSVYSTLTFTKDISTIEDVNISFKWNANGYDAGDIIRYKLVYDGIDQAYSTLCSACTSGWNTESISIPNTVDDVDLVLEATQNGSDYAGFDDVELTGLECAAACAEPTSDAVFFLNSPQSLTETSATLNFTVGDGDNRIVVLKETASITFVPVDNSTYTANSSFGTGTDVGTGEYVVSNGTSSSVVVTDLTPGAEYYTTIYEYGCTPGLEDYYTSGTPALDTFMTVPENPASFIEGCTGANTIDLSWTAPTIGNFDGYLLVVRDAAVPHAVTSLDPSAQTFNLDYSLAPTYGGGSRVLYNGTGTSASITGLTNGISYTFEVLTYSIGTAEFIYSSGTTTSQTINILDVSGQAVTGGDMQAEVVWANPNPLCFDEILVVANETSGIDFTPTGDGTAYTANTVYAGVNQVVYKGTGVTELITALTNGTTYYFEIFVRSGTEWSQGVEVSVIPSTATIFEPGDMAIIAFNTDNSSTEDEFCFFAYKDITEGTAIDFTDNGYGRVNDGEWGDTEGVIRITRNSGGTILAGTVICLQGNGNDDADFEIYNCGVLDDANWTVSSLNGPTTFFNFNTTDQVWIMQGGSWVNPTGSHNASYTGNLTYGFTATGWEPAHGFASTSGSELYEGTECYNTDVDGVANSDKVKYTGPVTITDQGTWITRINNSANWTGYADNAAYNSGGSDYIGSCIVFPIDNSTGFTEGVWEGDVDNNWFNCANWQDLKVPDETVDVVIVNTASNEANFDQTNPFADIYGGIANCKDLTIEDNIWVEGISDIDTIKVHGNLVLEDDALLDLNGVTTGAVMELGGNFTNNDPDDDAFDEDKSLVIFNGTGQQDVNTAHSSNKEDFFNLTVSKTSQTKVNLNDDVEVKNVLSFESGIIKTNTNKVYVSAGNVGDITGYEAPNGTGTYTNNKYVEGNLEREISAITSYEFPVGDDPSALGYNPIVLTVQSGTGSATGKFVNGAPGSISVDDVSNTCSGSPVLISYTTMTGLGYWNFESATTYAYDVMLHPNTSNMNTAPNSDGQYRALKAPSGTAGGTWPTASGTDGDFCTVSSNYFAIPGVGYTGFSDFGVGGGTSGPALPVELLYFEAESVNEVVVLNWATVTEVNNDFFTLERSKEGQNYEKIGTVQGAGNYNGKLDYTFMDGKPLDGISYYRLKQTDFDGTFEYSEIRIVNRKTQEFEIGNIYPNPTSNNLFVPISILGNESIILNVIDISGRLVISEEIKVNSESNLLELNLSNLLPGAYILNFETNSAFKNLRFIKK